MEEINFYSHDFYTNMVHCKIPKKDILMIIQENINHLIEHHFLRGIFLLKDHNLLANIY